MDEPFDFPPLAGGQVQVWVVPLDLPEESWRAWEAGLPADERQRAERYAFPELRRRFVVARTALRRLLGAQLGLPAGKIRFTYSPHGKPALAGDPSATGLRFNLSHSADLALVAIARGRWVGVDLEKIHPIPELGALAEQLLSPRERTFLDGLPAEARLVAFFRFWTCKEALSKALGWGLSRPMNDVEIRYLPEGQPQLMALPGVTDPATRWSIRALPVRAGYCAALAVEGDAIRSDVYPYPIHS